MSKTKKLSKSWTSSRLLEDSPLNCLEILSQLSLKKYCSKKSFEIAFAIPLATGDVLEQIVATGKEYERYSDTNFITSDDVLDLLKRLNQPEGKIELPKNVKDCAQKIISADGQDITSPSLELLALLTKLKIVESMYKIYCCEVGSMQRRNTIQEELAELIKNCEDKAEARSTKDAKKSKSDQKTKKSKSDKGTKVKKSQSSKISVKEKSKSQIIDDYTDIPLNENETVFDHNVDNHFMYLIISGFQDPLILKELIKMGVEISAVIDVGLNSQEPNSTIPKLEGLFETPKHCEFLENTAWLKYRTGGEKTPKETLEEFLHVVKKINHIKRQHLAYIKGLFLWNLGATPTPMNPWCLEKYTRTLDSYSSELINVPLIINSLIDEICWRESGSIYSLSDLSSSSSGSVSVVENDVKPYRSHEEDFLKMGMKSYKEPGRQYYDKSLNYLKLLPPLQKLDQSSEIRSRNRAVSTQDDCYCDYTEELFDYFHLAIFNQMRRTQFVPQLPQDYNFTKNLATYNQTERYREQTRGFPTSDAGNYSVIDDYHLKEDLSTSVLYQLVFRALKEYTDWDRFLCEESGATLLRFHDNLNELGVETKMWDQNLRTPVCLRDFCRFITNEEKEWIEENPLKTHETNQEECQGLINIHLSEMYQEYQHLLETTSDVTREQKKEEFERVLNELLTYPKSASLVNHCQGTRLAYDLGPQLCQLTGNTTTFHSDDGIKATIDTTRFVSEDPKCTITVDVDGNSLVFHKTRPQGFHFNLQDDTVVSFTEFDTSLDEILTARPLKTEYVSEEIPEEASPEEAPEEEEDPNYKDYWLEILRKSKIPDTVPNFSEISAKKVQLDDENLRKMLELFKAAVYKERPIYKISTKPSVGFLKRTDSPVRVPLVLCLKKILFKPVPKKRKIRGYSVLNFLKSKQKVPSKYDFQIVLPNGLLITTLPRNKKLAEIKQEYKYNLKKEKYRIFYSSGIVLVKHNDGTVTIYRANGDMIRLSDDNHCSRGTCAKDMVSVFQNQEKIKCPYETSRCVESYSKKVGPAFVKLYEFGEIPYLKKTLIDVEGRKTEIYKDKMREEQAFFVTSEHDHRKEEIIYEREDGMRSMVDRKGIQIFHFPDGTKITAIPEFDKELIYIGSKATSEGWVSVMVSYKFEHPDYVTVQYDNIRQSTHIFLKNATIKTDQESFVMSLGENVGLDVSSDRIILLKTCTLCDRDCICEIYTKDDLKFFEILDSYGKHLTCDPSGHCQLSSDFVRGGVNKNGCNHRWRNEKQKLFVLNERGPPGAIFWHDSLVEAKMALFIAGRNTKISNYINKLTNKQTLEFTTEVRQNFPDRFTMPLTDQCDICLTKNKYLDGRDKSKLFYITYRILVDFRNSGQELETVAELQEFLDNQIGGASNLLLDGVLEMLKSIKSDDGIGKNSVLSYRLGVKDQEDSISSTKSSKKSDLVKVDVREVVDKWRATCKEYREMIKNMTFPGYFHSEYYRTVLVERGLKAV